MQPLTVLAARDDWGEMMRWKRVCVRVGLYIEHEAFSNLDACTHVCRDADLDATNRILCLFAKSGLRGANFSCRPSNYYMWPVYVMWLGDFNPFFFPPNWALPMWTRMMIGDSPCSVSMCMHFCCLLYQDMYCAILERKCNFFGDVYF
jgi:hypothetical protein